MPDAAGSSAVGRTAPRWLVVLVVALAVVFIVVLFFLLGRRLPWFESSPAAVTSTPAASASAETPATTPSPTPTTIPSADAAAPATGPVAAGVHDWTELRGGECLDPYVSAWEQSFTVVDCAAPHGAQLIARAILNADPAAAYPGEAAITSQLNLACTAPAVLDFGAAAAFADVQWQASYPVTAEQWASGVREYSCFISRSSGQPLVGSVRVAPAG